MGLTSAHKIAVRAGLILAFFSYAGPAVSGVTDEQQDTAEQLIRGLGEQAINTVSSTETALQFKQSEFRGLLKQGFDLDYIGRFVLGKYRRSVTGEQLADYTRLFEDYILLTYASRLSAYEGEKFKVIGSRPTGKKSVIVLSEIRPPSGGGKLDADWRVRFKDGKPYVVDIQVEGISMAITQREEFSAILNRSGMNGLLALLRERVALQKNEKLHTSALQ